MDIVDLPVELQNKIFFMVAEHPLASIFKKHVKTENCIVYTEREIGSELKQPGILL